MDSDKWQALAMLVVGIWQVYEYGDYPLFARIWRWIADFARSVAELFGWISLNAEINYYESLESHGA